MKLTDISILSQLMPYCVETNNIIVGYSGGVDSHSLLHLLANIPELKHKITAVYVHHGLQSCADEWAEHCNKVSVELSVKFRELKVDARAVQGQSPEEAARNARYQAFKGIITENDILLFAQHRNDQLETVLLQLFRGAGLKGLSGMPAVIRFGAGMLIRPLLEVSQKDINQYALQHDLQWIEDPSNQDTQFDRNYLRHDILPLLEQRWPGLDKTVARVAQHCADAQAMLSASSKENMYLLHDRQKRCLSIAGLLKHDKLMQQWIIREWLSHLGARMPTQKVMTAIVQNVLLAGPEANPIVQHGSFNIQRYRDGLYLTKIHQKPDLSHVSTWVEGIKSLSLPNNDVLIIKDTQQGIAKYLWQQGNVQVKYRQGGEKIALPNRDGRHSLKKLYQEAAIAPWLRDVIPLIYINGKLAAIAGYWVSADFYGQNEACISLFWEKR